MNSLGDLKNLLTDDIQKYVVASEDFSEEDKKIFTITNPNWYNEVPYILPDWKIY